MKVAFFDFDGTITRHDTLFSFAEFSVGKKRLVKAIIMAGPTLLLWKLGLKSNSEAKEKLFYYLYRGMKYETFRRYGEKFAAEINKDTRPDIKAKLNSHLFEGTPVYIVSASIREWIEPWAKEIGIEDVISTMAEVNEFGRLTGYFSTPNCNAEEKVKRMRQQLPNLSEMEIWAYGDSSGDDAMLEIADHPDKL